MVIKLYISGISGNKEVKKKQQRVQMILDSKQITYEAIDITEPGKEKDKEFMQQNGKVRESLGKYPLPPQIFNDDDFCGDYEDFDLANEIDELEKFLHLSTTNSKILDNELKVNGVQEQIIDSTTSDETEQAEEVKKNEVNGDIEDVTSTVKNDIDSSSNNFPEENSIPVKEDEVEANVELNKNELCEEKTEIMDEEEMPQNEEKNEENLQSDKESDKESEKEINDGGNDGDDDDNNNDDDTSVLSEKE